MTSLDDDPPPNTPPGSAVSCMPPDEDSMFPLWSGLIVGEGGGQCLEEGEDAANLDDEMWESSEDFMWKQLQFLILVQ